MIAKASDIRQENVEVILLPNEELPKEAKFMIRLDIDFTSLPGRTDKADEDNAMLMITFAQADYSRTPQLYLTRQLEEIFVGQAAIHLPCQRNKYLIDYINEVKKLISAKVLFSSRLIFFSPRIISHEFHLIADGNGYFFLRDEIQFHRRYALFAASECHRVRC